jgi:hypothetical protein
MGTRAYVDESATFDEPQSGNELLCLICALGTKFI